MIQLRPDQGEERDGDAAPRPPINVVYAGSGPATFLSTGLSFELEPDILMPPVTHPQGLWVVPAAEFPVSLPGQQAPTELLKPASADLLDVPEREVWPSEALDERLLRYSGEAAELVLLTTPEYENGWRALHEHRSRSRANSCRVVMLLVRESPISSSSAKSRRRPHARHSTAM